MPSRKSSDSTQQLLRIARSISDREPIAWETELERAPGLSRTLDRLRGLETLAAVHESAAPRSSAGSWPAGDAAVATPDAVDPRGLTSWGPLQILESLGRGGFGHVYRAYDAVLEREVALKLWRRGPAGASLLTEARALARLRHPNLPTVHGVDEHAGWLGMWTDLVGGRTLEQRLASGGPMNAREAARVAIQVCRALAAVHEAGLVHRDVKTANVMLDAQGRVMLVDFGLAIEHAAGGERARAAGTPPCMAPELLRGERATPACDLYALGVLLYRATTRAHPYAGRSSAEVARQQERGDRVEIEARRPDLPAAFVDVVRRALATDPAQREASAVAMEESLQAFLDSRAAAAPGEELRGKDGEMARLPHFLTRFIGRDEELAECLEALHGHRLVTLLGLGGAGKTRLAVRAAEALAESGTGVAFADLAAISDPAVVEPEVRRALDAARGLAGDPTLELARAIGSTPLLLVLDNCEHLVERVSALTGSLLAACPRLRVLATSRCPLRVPGERAMAVPPLGSPPLDVAATVAAVSSFDAVRLFVERARLVRPDFRLTDQNATAVAEVCRRADGLPLAIELAAARARALTPEEIRDHLAAGPRLLSRADFSSTARHGSLEAAIRWSYDSLPLPQRALMDGLAVFVGSFTLRAATQVCGDGASELQVLDSITSLIEQSLVSTAPACLGVTRYRLLDTLRGFALEQLMASPRSDALAARHFEFYLALAEEAEPHLWSREQAEWSERLDADHPNLQAALHWAAGQPERAPERLRLAGALARFWTERGHLTTGREALTAVVERDDSSRDAPALARALLGAATLAIYQSDHAQARAWATRALELYRGRDDAAGIARTLVTLGIVAHEVSDYAAAEVCYRESLELFRRLGDGRGEAHVLNNLGAITWRQDRWEEARRLHREALAHAEPARDPGLRALALTNLGFVAHHLGDMTEAATCLAEALGLVREHRLMRHAASTVEAAAAVLAQRRESARAARLYAAADQQRRDLGNRQEPAWRKAHEPALAAAARDLGPERFASETRLGRGLGLAAAIEQAARGLELTL